MEALYLWRQVRDGDPVVIEVVRDRGPVFTGRRYIVAFD